MKIYISYAKAMLNVGWCSLKKRSFTAICCIWNLNAASCQSNILNKIWTGYVDEDVEKIRSRFFLNNYQTFPAGAVHIYEENGPVNTHKQSMVTTPATTLVVVKTTDSFPSK